ncbi:hypothetical protein Pelo_1267 [Pelomyxa schiedti]|nr:hypothetical protein Pelo_1267 [Pelomyxa schiedti]
MLHVPGPGLSRAWANSMSRRKKNKKKPNRLSDSAACCAPRYHLFWQPTPISFEPIDNTLGVLVQCRLCIKQYNEGEVVAEADILTRLRGPRTCDECEIKSACVSCSDCETALCSACDTAIHSHKIFRGHVRVPFSGHFPVREPRCTAHNKTFELFCPNCTELCCYGCSQFGNHKEHSSVVVLRSTAVPRVKSLLKSGLEEVKNSQVQIRKCSEDIDMCLSRLNFSSAALKTSISAEIQKIQQALARRQKILEEEVETKCGIISQPLLQSKRDLNLLENNTTKTIQAVGKILELDDELILLGASKLALGELSSAKTVTPHLPVINPNQDFVLPTFPGTEETLSAILQLTLKYPIGDTTTLLPVFSGVHRSPLLSASKPEPEQEEVEKQKLDHLELSPHKSPTTQPKQEEVVEKLVFQSCEPEPSELPDLSSLQEDEEAEPEQHPEAEQGKESSYECSLVPINYENCHWWPGHTDPTLLHNEAKTAISPQTPESGGVSTLDSPKPVSPSNIVTNDVGKSNERQQQEPEAGSLTGEIPQSVGKPTPGFQLKPLAFDPTKGSQSAPENEPPQQESAIDPTTNMNATLHVPNGSTPTNEQSHS